MKDAQLKRVTNELLKYTKTINDRFEKTKTSGEKADFYLEVKPFAEEVREANERWKQLSLDYINKAKSKDFHMNQVLSAFDQLEMVSIQAFYPDTSRTRFLNNIRSLQYVYSRLLAILN